MKNIIRMFNLIHKSIFSIDGNLNYDRLTDATINFCNLIHAYNIENGDDENIWNLGDSLESSLSDFIIGAYHHYDDWNMGQDSKGYLALSALDSIYSPLRKGFNEDIAVYEMLNFMAENRDKKRVKTSFTLTIEHEISTPEEIKIAENYLKESLALTFEKEWVLPKYKQIKKFDFKLDVKK